jgi:outer membrane protein TolC
MEVKALEQSVKGYRSGASATRANAWPRLDATGDVTYANPNQRIFPPAQEFRLTYSAGIAASWTVFDTAIQSSIARELDATAESTEARRLEVKNGIANEVNQTWLDLARTRENFGHQQVALAAAEEAYRVTTELFRAGRATGTDLIESENQLLLAKLGEIETRINLVVASINLRHATGRDIPAQK